MKFNNMMHVSFFVEDMERSLDFYTNKLGMQPKIITRAKVYKGNVNRPQYAEIAEKDPERILIIYLEAAPGQFIELFPKNEGMKPHTDTWNDR